MVNIASSTGIVYCRRYTLKETDKTLQYVAVQTPWGLVEPRFIPEGVSPASEHLQSTMTQMFGSILDWAIVIFANVLLLAHDEEDAIS